MHGRGTKIFGTDIKKNLMYIYTFPPKKTLKGYKNDQLTLNNGTSHQKLNFSRRAEFVMTKEHCSWALVDWEMTRETS